MHFSNAHTTWSSIVTKTKSYLQEQSDFLPAMGFSNSVMRSVMPFLDSARVCRIFFRPLITMLLIVVHKSSFRFKQVLHTREAQQSHTKNYIEECYSPTATSSGRIDRYVTMSVRTWMCCVCTPGTRARRLI